MTQSYFLNEICNLKVNPDFSISIKHCPTIKFDKSTAKSVISYHGPNGFGVQYFSFVPSDFIFCFNQAKYKHQKSKFDYVDFDTLFFKNFYPKANDAVKYIFHFFSITPTIIEKSKHLNPSIHRVLPLPVKPAHVFKFYNIVPPKKSNETRKYLLDIDEVNRLNSNMEMAAKRAAISCDFSYFDIYLENYIELRKLNRLPTFLSPRMLNNIKTSFSKMVDTIQIKLYNNPEE